MFFIYKANTKSQDKTPVVQDSSSDGSASGESGDEEQSGESGESGDADESGESGDEEESGESGYEEESGESQDSDITKRSVIPSEDASKL